MSHLFAFYFYSFQTISILLSFALWFFLRALSSTRTHTLNSRTHFSRTVQYKNYLFLHGSFFFFFSNVFVHRSWQLEWVLHTHTHIRNTYAIWRLMYLLYSLFSHLLPRIYMGVRWLDSDFSFTHFASESVSIEEEIAACRRRQRKTCYCQMLCRKYSRFVWWRYFYPRRKVEKFKVMLEITFTRCSIIYGQRYLKYPTSNLQTRFIRAMCF